MNKLTNILSFAYTKTTLLLFIIYNLTFNISYAQHPEAKRATHWYFGNGAGLDFSSGSPVADTNGQLIATKKMVKK